MALKKSIIQDDGVTTTYHRILYVQNMINSHSSIAVVSLISDDMRDKQKNGELNQPYQKAVTYETEDHWNMSVDEAYKYLKTLPEFEGAEDI